MITKKATAVNVERMRRLKNTGFIGFTFLINNHWQPSGFAGGH
jgi:hypothetical protein